jgi:tripartite-type tricarboxylate transporter receptor subunit TctC
MGRLHVMLAAMEGIASAAITMAGSAKARIQSVLSFPSDCIPISVVLPLIQEGKLQALAVGSSTRATSLPDVPTTTEAGLAKSDYNFWLGIFAPAKTPQDVVAKLYRETQAALQLPTVKEALGKLGVDQLPMDTTQFRAFVHSEIVSNAELVHAANITIK